MAPPLIFFILKKEGKNKNGCYPLYMVRLGPYKFLIKETLVRAILELFCLNLKKGVPRKCS